jgi:hypothetical protein
LGLVVLVIHKETTPLLQLFRLLVVVPELMALLLTAVLVVVLGQLHRVLPSRVVLALLVRDTLAAQVG